MGKGRGKFGLMGRDLIKFGYERWVYWESCVSTWGDLLWIRI